MADVVQGLLFRARSQTSGATRDLRGILGIMADLNGAISLVQRGLRGMTMIFREGVGASIEQERVFLRLDRALRGLNTTYAENQERLSSYFAEVQRTTRFGDDVTAEVMGRVATATRSLGVGVDQLEEMTSLVLDYSEATGRDAVSSSRALAQVFAGNVEMLGRMVPAYRDAVREIGKLEDPAERSAAAMAILNEEFGGAAENIDPLDLAFARIANGLGDIREALGDLVRESPQMQQVFGGIADKIDDVATMLGNGGDAAEGFGLAIANASELGITAIEAVADAVLTALQAVSSYQPATDVVASTQAMQDARQAQAAIDEYLNSPQTGVGGAMRAGRVENQLRAMGFSSDADLFRQMTTGTAPTRVSRAGVNAVSGPQSPEELLRQVSRGLDDILRVQEDAVSQARSEYETISEDFDTLRNRIRGPARRRSLFERGFDALDTYMDDLDLDTGTGTGGPPSLADRLPGVMAGLTGRGKEDLTPLLDEWIDRLQVLPEMWTEFGEVGVWAMGLISAGFDEMEAKMQRQQEAAMAAKLATIEAAQADAEVIAGINTDFASAMQTMVGDVTADALVSMSDAIVAGGDSLEAFGGTVLSSLTKMAKGIGATYIATGIPMLIPGPLFNPAAGGAYLKYGGLLLGGGTVLGLLSGGGGGGAGAGSAPEAAMRSQSQARPIERTTVNATYIDTVVTEDERTMRTLNTRMERQRALGSGGL